MADEYDVDDLLEAALNYKQTSSTHSEKTSNSRGTSEHGRDRDRDHDRDRERDHRRGSSSSKDKEKDKDKDRSRSDRKSKEGRRDKEKEKDRSRSPRGDRDRDRERRKSRDRERSSRKSRSRSPNHRSSRHSRRSHRDSPERVERVSRNLSRSRSKTPPRLRPGPKRSRSPIRLGGDTPLSPEERDARTVFCMQLSQRVRARDLEDFFSSVGKVRDVRMITCNKTRRFKGIAYIEFKDIESVALALGLGGQRLLGVPIIVQPSQAEKNRAGQLAKAGAMAAATVTTTPGPMKLYVGSLHFNITEDMLRSIFEPFGRIDEILLMKDHESGRSKGFGFMTFHEGEDAKRAMEQLNGFEIAGRPMKVGYVTEKSETFFPNPQALLDSDEMDRAGVNLGMTGRLQLMAKLAEGTDLKLPEGMTAALSLHESQMSQNQYPQVAQQSSPAPPISTQCFMLSNMFDPVKEQENLEEIRDEVLEACAPHGGAVHAFVDMNTPSGNVYIKCPSVSAAVAAVNTLHGRWFGGRVITAAYVPLLNYHSLFPDSMVAHEILQPSKK